MAQRKLASKGKKKTARPARLEGGCYCGLVRYRINAKPLYVVHCHCGMCRRASGAPVVTWLTVDSKNLTFTRAQPVFFSSSSRADRSFCDRCGTSLTFQYKARRETIDVTACSLNDPEQITPRSHVHTASQLSWIRMDDGLRRYKSELGSK